MTIQNNSQDLLNFLLTQANSGAKDWFGFKQQKIAGIDAAYKIAIAHADKMSPEEVTDYVVRLNNSIFNKLLKG
jgi:ribosomal protein L11 methylase PrmA